MLKLELTAQDIAIILELLSQGPYRAVASIIASISQQVEKQQAAGTVAETKSE